MKIAQAKNGLIDSSDLLAELAQYRKLCASKGLVMKVAALQHVVTVVKRQRQVVVGPVVASVAPNARPNRAQSTTR